MPRKKVFFQDSLRHFHLTKTIRIQIQSNRRTNQYHIINQTDIFKKTSIFS